MTRYAWVLIAALTLTACSAVGPHTPVINVDSGEILDFTINGSVAVENAQADSAPVDLNFRGIVVNLNESTQALVDALRQELRSRAVQVTDGAGSKTLAVSVNRIEMISGFNVYRANIDISVVPGDREPVDIHATRASLLSGYNLSANPTKPLDVAMSDAVTQILTHPVVQRYLGE